MRGRAAWRWKYWVMRMPEVTLAISDKMLQFEEMTDGPLLQVGAPYIALHRGLIR